MSLRRLRALHGARGTNLWNKNPLEPGTFVSTPSVCLFSLRSPHTKTEGALLLHLDQAFFACMNSSESMPPDHGHPASHLGLHIEGATAREYGRVCHVAQNLVGRIAAHLGERGRQAISRMKTLSASIPSYAISGSLFPSAVMPQTSVARCANCSGAQGARRRYRFGMMTAKPSP